MFRRLYVGRRIGLAAQRSQKIAYGGVMRSMGTAAGAGGPNHESRASQTGRTVTIFGATGFLGRYVTYYLASHGNRVIVPFRGDDMEVRHLQIMGDYGMVGLAPYDPRSDDDLKRFCEGSEVVINMVSREWETSHLLPWDINFGFDEVNAEFPARLAEACLETGVGNYIHTSALAADPTSLSRWASSKAQGEENVRSVAPGATIVRPADIFGPEDRFLNWFAKVAEYMPRVPLVEGGAALTQPIYCLDVARSIYRIATSDDPDVMLGQTYDLAGPDVYSVREVAEYVFEATRSYNPLFINLTRQQADILGRVAGVLPLPLVHPEKMKLFGTDCVLDTGAATKRLHDLDLEATSMESPGFNWLHMYRTGGHLLDIQEQDRRGSAAESAKETALALKAPQT